MSRPVLVGSVFVAVVALLLVVISIPFLARDSGDDSEPTPPSAATNTPRATPTTTGGSSGSPSPAATPSPAAIEVPGEIEYEVAFPELPELERPVVMLEVPGQQRMLAALQDGRVVSFVNDPAARGTETVIDLRQQVSRNGNEEGLLGMALAPDFAASGHLFLYYSAKPGDRRTVLSRFETSGEGSNLRADPASELLLLTIPQPYPNHKGGQLAFGPDGMLYLALGDGGSQGDPQGNGQDISRNLLGSIIRIDVSGSSSAQPYAIPPDNPFAAQQGVQQETWAFGLRNPWRFSFDRETGVLWAGDVGQGDREEIDIIVAGGNYGWPIMEGTQCYKPRVGCNQSGLVLPVADYGHDDGACSVTGGAVYRGSAVPSLRGVYVYADYCSGAMWGLPAAAAEAGQPVEPVQWRQEGPNISSFAEDLAGELYFLAFDGKIYRITSAK